MAVRQFGLRTGRFSIPMRGNESHSPTGLTFRVFAFSIPMRGNEDSLKMVEISGHAVFDPHEG